MTEGAITLVCWTCGLRTMVYGPAPRFALDLVDATKAVDWECLVTGHSVRCLCSSECAELSIRKDGQPRKRRPRGAPNRSGKWDPRNNTGLPEHMYPTDMERMS